MLFLESKDLVVGFFAETLSIISQIVKLFDFLDCVVNFTHIALVNPGLVAQLLSPYVDVASKHFILRLKVVVLC